MASVNPIETQKYLEGLDYPAGKQEIVEHARSKGADEDIVSALERIADREYEGPSGISEELGKSR